MKNFSRFCDWVSHSIDDLLHPYEINDSDESLTEMIRNLQDRVSVLEQENISITNELYRLENSLDARIDILVEHYRINKDV